MRLEISSRVRKAGENEAEKLMDEAINLLRDTLKIKHPVDISFIMRNALDTALVKDRILNR